MYGAPIQTQRFGGGFSVSRFQPSAPRKLPESASMGVVIGPAVMPISTIPPVAPVAPFVYPPGVIAPTGQILVTQPDVTSDENKVVAILIALGLFGLGASLF